METEGKETQHDEERLRLGLHMSRERFPGEYRERFPGVKNAKRFSFSRKGMHKIKLLLFLCYLKL